MSTRIQLLSFIALAAAVFSAPGLAQTKHNMPDMAVAMPAPNVAEATMGEGLVKKIDKTMGTVTLAHGALPNGMPPMTMAYKVKDAAWLDKMTAGQKIRFATDPADGMTVSRFEPAK